MLKKITAIILALVTVLVFAGCNMVTVNEQRDGAQVIIQVGEHTVTKSQMAGAYQRYIGMYANAYGMTEEEFKKSYADTYEELLNTLVESYTKSLFVDLMKEEYNITLSEDDEKAIESSMQSNYEHYTNLAEKDVEKEKDLKEEDKTAKIDAAREKYLNEAGYYDGSMRKNLEDGYYLNALKDYLDKDYTATEDELKEFYEKNLEEQKKVLDENPSNIANYETSSEVSLYVPEGLRYMQALQVALEDADQTAITTARENKDDENADETADKLRDEALAKIKDKAEEMLAAANEDFSKAIETYGDSATKSAKDNSVRTYKGSAAYPTEVTDALFGYAESKAGAVSGLIATDKGYYVIKFLSVMTPGEKSLSEVHDDLMEKMINDHKEDSFTTAYSAWKDENVITTYLDRLG